MSVNMNREVRANKKVASSFKLIFLVNKEMLSNLPLISHLFCFSNTKIKNFMDSRTYNTVCETLIFRLSMKRQIWVVIIIFLRMFLTKLKIGKDCFHIRSFMNEMKKKKNIKQCRNSFNIESKNHRIGIKIDPLLN